MLQIRVKWPPAQSRWHSMIPIYSLSCAIYFDPQFWRWYIWVLVLMHGIILSFSAFSTYQATFAHLLIEKTSPKSNPRPQEVQILWKTTSCTFPGDELRRIHPQNDMCAFIVSDFPFKTMISHHKTDYRYLLFEKTFIVRNILFDLISPEKDRCHHTSNPRWSFSSKVKK